MPANTPKVKKGKTAPNAAPLRPPVLIPKPRPNRPLPVKSVQHAAKAFKNFSLSRFPKGETPSNYVLHAQAKVPSAVNAVQRKAMAQQVDSLAARPLANPGITVALPDAVIAELLPSFNAAAGTVDLTELLGVLRIRMQGTDFYASGNPTLNRVVQDSALLSQVQAYINAIKAGGA
jgi:hypothetical protein